MKPIFLFLVITSCCLHSIAQTSDDIVKKKFYQGNFGDQDTTAGYTEAVLIGNVLYISGAIGKGTIEEQLQVIYSHHDKILKAYGATHENVVKETLFTTDIEAVKKNNSVRKAFYKGDFPAATWVQITRLYSPRPDAQIEVELIAHLPKKKKNDK